MGKRGPRGPLRGERALEIGTGGGRLHGAVGERGPFQVHREAELQPGSGPWRVSLQCPGLVLLGSRQSSGSRGRGEGTAASAGPPRGG